MRTLVPFNHQLLCCARDIEPDHKAPPGAPASHSDADLLAAMARGQAAALDQLYLRYRKPAFATAYTLLRDPGAAEDAVHDAFINAWRAAASFRPERGAPRAWLLTIVRNAALDQVRQRRTARRYQPRLYQIDSDADSDMDVASEVASAADGRRVRAALAALPVEQRRALEMAFFTDLTHGEIAQRTGAPLGTVKGRVRLGLRRLRHDLRDLGPAARSA